MPGIHSKERIQHSQHGGSLCVLISWCCHFAVFLEGAVHYEEHSFFWIPWLCEQQCQLLATDCQIWGTIYFISSKHVLKNAAQEWF
jgi:hypothetical protein